MRKWLLALILLCSAGLVCAQVTIGFVSAEQYETVSGWRLHVVLDMGEMLFPPTGYERTEMMLSTMTMGVYEPYDAIATLERKIAERDPEFPLLGKMDTQKTWYARIRIWANGVVVSQTSEFTFILTGDEPDKYFHGDIPWAAVDSAWQTSFAFHNSSDDYVDVTYNTWTGPVQNPILLTNTVTIWPHQTYSGYLFPEAQIHAAVEITSTKPVSWMSLLNLRDTDVWIGFNGVTE